MLKVIKINDNLYKITDDEYTIEINQEKFEDLYYAVPLNNSEFLRLLQDNICTSDKDRESLNKMLEKGERTKLLDNLQKEIQKFKLD